MALVAVSEGSGGGSFLPIVKYDARAGRLFRVDKSNGVSDSVDITRAFKAVLDFENVEVGYILIASGVAPDFKLVPFGQALPEKPTPAHKAGVRFSVKLAKECGGDVREMSSTAGAFLRGINALHDTYLTQKAANPDKLPVVILKDTLPVTSGSGDKKSTNYQPVFEIAGWAARPGDLKSSGDGAAPKSEEPPPHRETAESEDFG